MKTINQLQEQYLIPRLKEYKDKLLETRGVFLQRVIRRILPWNKEYLIGIDRELARIEELMKGH